MPIHHPLGFKQHPLEDAGSWCWRGREGQVGVEGRKLGKEVGGKFFSFSGKVVGKLEGAPK